MTFIYALFLELLLPIYKFFKFYFFEAPLTFIYLFLDLSLKIDKKWPLITNLENIKNNFNNHFKFFNLLISILKISAFFFLEMINFFFLLIILFSWLIIPFLITHRLFISLS
jgi:hypothetical protein